MAIGRRVRLAFRVRRSRITRIANGSSRYPDVQFAVGGRQASLRVKSLARTVSGGWSRYCVAPAVELGAMERSPVELIRGIDALVDSDLPAAVGLSSSSALVNAVGIALSWANGWQVCRPAAPGRWSEKADLSDRLRLAALMADAERHVGTRGGGMDQAVTLCAREDQALRIDFEPLRVRSMPFPGSWRIVVADSGVPALKGSAVRDAYNRRRDESETALDLVTRHGPWDRRADGPPRLAEMVATTGHEDAIRLGERALRGRLLRRFRHVISEARRVAAACDVLTRPPADRSLERARYRDFGRLMNHSHASLRSDYEVSVPELDTLVGCLRSGGCVGARLTGAGFGGSAIGLVEAGKEGAVLDLLEERFYGPAGLAPRAFVARPAGGAEARPLGMSMSP